jgi:hypothetical protein
MARKTDGDSSAPSQKKQGRLSQIKQVYQVSKQADPNIGRWMLLGFLATVAVFLIIGFVLKSALLFGIMGVLFGVLAATIIMSRRAERAAYRSIEGQAGAAGAALTSIRRGWYTDREPVAADVARPGRVQKLLVKEQKRVERVAPGVPVTTMVVGEGEGQVPLSKVASKVQRLKPAITKDEMALVNKRLKALGGIRPPIPQGVDPTRARMDRRALRGK